MKVFPNTHGAQHAMNWPWSKRQSWVVALGCAFLAMAISCGANHHPRPTAPRDRDAPDFTARTLEGAPVQLASFRGRVVVLHLWAAWSCAEELPGLDNIASNLASSGVVVLAVSIDKDRSALHRVAKSRPSWNLKILHEQTGEVAGLYRPSAFPSAYVIDQQGWIRHQHVGIRNADLPQLKAEAQLLASQNSARSKGR